jgi:hypothetical protein
MGILVMAVDIVASGGGVALDVMIIVATVGSSLVRREHEHAVLTPIAVGDRTVIVVVVAVIIDARDIMVAVVIAFIGAGAERQDECGGANQRGESYRVHDGSLSKNVG